MENLQISHQAGGLNYLLKIAKTVRIWDSFQDSMMMMMMTMMMMMIMMMMMMMMMMMNDE